MPYKIDREICLMIPIIMQHSQNTKFGSNIIILFLFCSFVQVTHLWKLMFTRDFHQFNYFFNTIRSYHNVSQYVVTLDVIIMIFIYFWLLSCSVRWFDLFQCYSFNSKIQRLQIHTFCLSVASEDFVSSLTFFWQINTKYIK